MKPIRSSRDPSLIDAIDEVALKLLRKIGGDSNMSPEQGTIFTEQVKAFDTVIKWANTRQPLIAASEPPKETKFGSLQRKFHAASPANKRGGSDSSASPAGGSAAIIDFPGADTPTDEGDDAD